MLGGRHFDQSVILPCVRWYLTHNLSLRDPEEMTAERGIQFEPLLRQKSQLPLTNNRDR